MYKNVHLTMVQKSEYTCSWVKKVISIGASIPAGELKVLIMAPTGAAKFGDRSSAFTRHTTVDAPFRPRATVIKATQ